MDDHRLFSKDWFYYSIIGAIIFEVIMLAAFTLTIVNWALLPIIVLFIVWLLNKNIRWALLLPLAELSVGSFGSGIMWEIYGFIIPLRLVIFVTVILIWLFKIISGQENFSFRSNTIVQFLALIIIVVWGVFAGLVHNNSIANIFFDSNAFLYVFYLPIWISVFRFRDLKKIVSILLGTTLVLSIKTLLLFFAFGSQYELLNIQYLYIWVRDTRIGEITLISDSFWRIFIQSQLYIGVSIIWLITYIFSRVEFKCSWKKISLLSFYIAAISISLSRSIWLGIIATVIIAGFVFIPYLIKRWRFTLNGAWYLISAFFMSGGIIILLSSIILTSGTLGNTLLNRFSDSGNEPAGMSRLQLLQPMMDKIWQHPFAGSGFGTEITYNSSDPRYKNSMNPEGTITTYAFELGYLDQWIKIGGIFMFLFLFIILYQFYRGLQVIEIHPDYSILVVALLLGLLYIMIVHSLSPYLNHPLGLGYLMLVMAVMHRGMRQRNYG